MPSPPEDLFATASGSSTCDVTWTNPEIYNAIELWWTGSGAGWHAFPQLDGEDTEYEVTGMDLNETLTLKIRGYDGVGKIWSDFSDEVDVVCSGETITDTLTLSDAFDYDFQGGADDFYETLTLSDDLTDDTKHTFTDTLTFSDFLGGSSTVHTDWGYYIGTSAGTIHEYSSDYVSDAGEIITSTWRSKEMDFADQNPKAIDHYKTVYAVKVFYVDKNTHTITVSVSNDSGQTWDSISRSIGTGSNANLVEIYHFIITGEDFVIKVEHASTSTVFQLHGIEVQYDIGGEYFDTGA